MAEENNKQQAEEAWEYDAITLCDEEGKEHVLEILAEVEYNGKLYRALVPFAETEEEAQAAELIYMRVGQDDEGVFYDLVEDDEELLQVDKLFSEILSEEFDIEK